MDMYGRNPTAMNGSHASAPQWTGPGDAAGLQGLSLSLSLLLLWIDSHVPEPTVSLLVFVLVRFVNEWMICAAESSMWGGLGLGKSETYPERAGAPDCAYYMRTGVCGYASRCRFNHPPDRATVTFFFFYLLQFPFFLYTICIKNDSFKKKKNIRNVGLCFPVWWVFFSAMFQKLFASLSLLYYKM